MELEKMNIYVLAMELGEVSWKTTESWDFFSKDTVGKQLVRAADSVGANISEGYGRFSFKEKINFSYYSRGSLYETKTWITKAKNRNLITIDDYHKINDLIKDLGIKLNNYISSLKKNAK